MLSRRLLNPSSARSLRRAISIGLPELAAMPSSSTSPALTLESLRSVLPSPPTSLFFHHGSLFCSDGGSSPAVLDVEYAVRGAVPQKAAQYEQDLVSGKANLPFKKIVNANIGNPQLKGLDQKPITWWRQVRIFGPA